MDVLKSMVLWVAFLLSCSSSGEAFHSESHHVDAFENILKTMRLNNSLELKNLTTLLKNLGLGDCSDKTAHLHQCVTAKSLFNIFNITTTSSIKETEFAKIATVIVYSLLPMIENHSTDNHNKENRFLTQKVDVYEELLQRYVTNGLCEQVLDQLLRDINESIGKRLNKPKCFSSHDILHEMNISNQSEITKSKLPELSTIIISKLLDRQCIKVEHQTPLPCPSYFVDDLFQKFANNNFIDKKKMKELLKQLKIGNRESTGDKTDGEHNHNDHNRRKRSPGKYSQSYSDNGANMESQQRNKGRVRREAKRPVKSIYKKCYSADELFSIYQVDENTGANVERFQHLSSALLQQIESNVCVEEKRSKKDEKKTSPVWGYGLAAVSVISLLSVIMIIPLMQASFYNKALIFLVSLAVGTLVGDALLHLLPHATGFHDHDSGQELGEGGLIFVDKDKSYLWKFLAAVAGVYGLFLFETTTHLFVRQKPSEKQSTEQSAHSRREERNKPGFIKSLPETTRPAVVLVNMITKREEHSQISEKSVDGSSCETKEKAEQPEKQIASMAWTIIIGDTIHNIADGIAIGVAFSESIFGGISTSIAVLCHEVPHELGDFVVLLEAGMTVRQALLANFVSSWFCFLGLVLGKLIGEIEDVNLWILAVTAGFFLYIALTDKLPELMRLAERSDLSKRSILILQNLGIVLGFTGMLLLAFYKKDIDI